MKDELLRRFWHKINSHVVPYKIGRVLVREDELDNIIKRAKDRPTEPFADAGQAIERILASGASRRDVCLILRYAEFMGVFGVLSILDEEGMAHENVVGLHEELLSADPSGLEGRPGSADAATVAAHLGS